MEGEVEGGALLMKKRQQGSPKKVTSIGQKTEDSSSRVNVCVYIYVYSICIYIHNYTLSYPLDRKQRNAAPE